MGVKNDKIQYVVTLHSKNESRGEPVSRILRQKDCAEIWLRC